VFCWFILFVSFFFVLGCFFFVFFFDAHAV